MNDFRLFDIYRKENTHPNRGDNYCDVDYLLRFWRQNKEEYLAPLFGDSLIMERPIEYIRSDEELRRDMDDMTSQFWGLARGILDDIYREMDVDWNGTLEERDIPQQVYEMLQRALMNSDMLVSNRFGTLGWDNQKGTRLNGYTVQFRNGKKVAIQEGMKITRAFSQICAVLGKSEDWEKFRIAHSQVLNQKKLKGTLCLSIHPLDYATASDNDNGWSSCMSWREDGCYRMGTVEMMNSPMVICAYVKSDKQHMTIDDEEWNSKKWRAWIIVNRDEIICNRHYPFHQETFATQAIEWVRELVGEKYGWKYEDIHTDFYDYMHDTEREVEFITNYMYNDLGGDDVIGCFREGATAWDLRGQVCFSGPAECMVCGKEIKPDDQGADQLECLECYQQFCCDRCGCYIDEDDVYYGPEGEVYCSECYSDNCCTCSECDDTMYNDDAVQILFPIYRKRGIKFLKKHPRAQEQFKNWHGDVRLPVYEGEEVCLCPRCAEQYDLAHLFFDDDSTETDVEYYGSMTTFDPNKITAEKAFDVIHPRFWDYSVRCQNSRNYDSDDIEAAKEMREFWLDQWEAFKADFNNTLKFNQD